MQLHMLQLGQAGKALEPRRCQQRGAQQQLLQANTQPAQLAEGGISCTAVQESDDVALRALGQLQGLQAAQEVWTAGKQVR